MGRKLFDWWVPCGVVLAAILVRGVYVWGLPTDRLKWPDEQAFDEIAWKLVQVGEYKSDAYRATPVLPWFLAGVYRVMGHSYRAARVGQAVLGGVLVLAVYGIGLRLFGGGTGCLAAVGTAFYPALIYLCGVFYSEHMFAMLLAVTLFFFIEWHQKQRGAWLWAAGVALGLSALCRPVILAFVPLAIAYVAWNATIRERLRNAAFLALALAAVVAPWTIRNAIVFRHFVPVCTGFGLQLWRGNNDVARGDADDRHLMPLLDSWQQRVEQIADEGKRKAVWAEGKRLIKEWSALDEVEQDRLFAREGLKWMGQNPSAVFRLSTHRLLVLYSAFTRTRTQNEDVSSRNQIVASVSFYPVLAAGLAGMALVLRQARAVGILYAAIISVTLVYVLMTACTRFRLPLDALWILFASFSVTSAWERFYTRPHRTV